MATNVDEIQTPPSTMSYNSSSAITHTYNWNKSPKSAVNLSNYRRVTYNNLDKTVEHTFYVVFYGRKYSIYTGDATIQRSRPMRIGSKLHSQHHQMLQVVRRTCILMVITHQMVEHSIGITDG